MTEQQSTTVNSFASVSYCHCNSTSSNYARLRLSWLCMQVTQISTSHNNWEFEFSFKCLKMMNFKSFGYLGYVQMRILTVLSLNICFSKGW